VSTRARARYIPVHTVGDAHLSAAKLSTAPAPAGSWCGGCGHRIDAGSAALVWSSLGIVVCYHSDACRARRAA
jgi:hypothetical protein